MAIIKCKMCGGDLNIAENNSVAVCEYCGTQQTVPSADNEKKLTLFGRANRLRMACEFDKAAGVYESIVADFPEEAEAYWGLVLCKYGIEYVDDPATGKKIPTCHRSSFDSVMDDGNLEQALENADAIARRVYRDEAKAIEELRKGIIEVSGKEEPYDIFICYKETDDSGDRTIDSVIAQEVYDALTEKGYRVFFSRITLEDKLGQEYEPYIFAALHSAKIMLAFGTDYEYYNAVWVKNEWSRFLQLIAAGEKKTLIPCYKNIDAYDMPKEFARLQAQDMGKVGAMQDLLRGIEKILHVPTDKGNHAVSAASTGALTKRGYFFLEDGDFKSANEYFDRALDENPEDSKAYVGKVLAGLHLSNIEEIKEKVVKIYGDKNFERAIRFATASDRKKLEEVKEVADKKWLAKCLCVGLNNVAKKKKDDEIEAEVKVLAGTPTVEAYDKIVEIYAGLCARGVCSSDKLSTAIRQAAIMQVLKDGNQYDLQNIRRGTGTYYADATFLSDLNKMIAAGSVERGRGTDTYCLAGVKAARDEECYQRAAENAKNAKDIDELKKTLATLKELGNYKDSQDLIELCNKRIKEMLQQSYIDGRYAAAKEMMATAAKTTITEATREEAYKSAAEIFLSINEYKDAAALAEQCHKKVEEARKKKLEEARVALKSKYSGFATQRDSLTGQRNELVSEQKNLQTELANLKGLFSGKRRKEIEVRLSEISKNIAEIDAELKSLPMRLAQLEREMEELG